MMHGQTKHVRQNVRHFSPELEAALIQLINAPQKGGSGRNWMVQQEFIIPNGESHLHGNIKFLTLLLRNVALWGGVARIPINGRDFASPK